MEKEQDADEAADPTSQDSLGVTYGEHGALVNHYKERSWRETQSSTSAISFATSRIKQIIYKAKDQYLQTVVRDGPQSASHILQRVKKIGVGGRGGKTRARPLPLLLDHTWNPARSQQDHDDVCLHHFGKQECGTTMSVSKFLEETDVSEQLRQEVQWDISDLTVPEIEEPSRKDLLRLWCHHSRPLYRDCVLAGQEATPRAPNQMGAGDWSYASSHGSRSLSTHDGHSLSSRTVRHGAA